LKRSIEQAFADLQALVDGWAAGRVESGVQVFVYPPEAEAVMLARFPSFVQGCAARGCAIDLVDLGQGLLREIERRPTLEGRLRVAEQRGTDRVHNDLGQIAQAYVQRLFAAPLQPPQVCRLLINSGALGVFLSYSAVLNGTSSEEGPAVVLAFPGEADDRSLNLLELRTDTNYRVARV
jgi:hypothetical protein